MARATVTRPPASLPVGIRRSMSAQKRLEALTAYLFLSP